MTVSFGFGLELNIDRVAFNVFGMPIYWYGIIIALGFMLGLTLASVASKKLGENTDTVLDIALICAPCAVVLARLYYVIFKWSYYKDNLLEIIDLRQGGIAIYGAIIGGILGAYIYSKIKKKSVLKIFDIGSVGLITGQMIGRWGNFFNQEAFGTNTFLPWAMKSEATKSYLETLKLNGVNVNPEMGVHPTFLYESLWSLLTLICLFVILYKYYRFNGQVFFAYMFLYGLGRFFIEGLRTDSLMIGSIRVSQLLGILFFVIFLVLYIISYKKSMTGDKIYQK